MENFNALQHDIRREIASVAAKLISEDGYDYPSARQKAVKQIAGDQRLSRDLIPLDQEIEAEVRAYQAIYQTKSQPIEQMELRQVAHGLLVALAEFEPIVYGALVNGTANKHSDIHVIAFADNPKEIDYWLLNQNINFEPCEDALLAGRSFPAVAIQWNGHWVQLGSADYRQRRGLLNKGKGEGKPFQTDLNGLKQLIDQSNSDNHSTHE